MGSDDATASMHRTHQEIFRRARLLDRLVRDLPPDGPSGDDRTDLQRLLYGLEAILRLHQAQEEDLYLVDRDSAAPPDGRPPRRRPSGPDPRDAMTPCGPPRFTSSA